MPSDSRDYAVRDMLSAVIDLVTHWNAVSTQGSVATEVGVDIPASDVRALYTIGLLGGAVRPAELADALAQSRPTTSKLIGRLEAAGFVERERASGDLRSVDIVFTERGRDSYARLVAEGARMVEQASTDMTTAEIEGFTEASRRLAREFRD